MCVTTDTHTDTGTGTGSTFLSGHDHRHTRKLIHQNEHRLSSHVGFAG